MRSHDAATEQGGTKGPRTAVDLDTTNQNRAFYVHQADTNVGLGLLIFYSAGWADHANQGAMMIMRSVERKVD